MGQERGVEGEREIGKGRGGKGAGAVKGNVRVGVNGEGKWGRKGEWKVKGK